MSDVSSNSHGKRAVQALHASSAASDPSQRGGTSRPQMHPTRLFTAQINSILKDKDRPRPRNLCRISPEPKSCVREGNAGTPPTVPDKNPPPRSIFEHLSDREGPSGAEDDGDPLEKVSMTLRDPSETIHVKIKTNIVIQEPEDEMHIANLDETIQVKVETTTDKNEAEAKHIDCSDESFDESVIATPIKSELEGILSAHPEETIQVSVSTSLAATESSGVLPSSSGLDITCEEVTSTALSFSPVSSSDLQGSPRPIHLDVGLVECSSWLKDSEDSDCEDRESTVGGSDSVCSKSESKSRKKSSISSSKKTKKSKHSESRRSKRQLSPMASKSHQKRSLDHRDVNHGKKKKKDRKRKSATGVEDSNDELVQGQYLSVVKTSSSGGSDDDSKTSPPTEVSGCKLLTISKHQSFNSFQPAFNCQISETISKSSAPDFIPLELSSNCNSLKPDTPYKIPTISQSPLHYESPSPGYPPQRPLFFYESWMSTPPPPPPTMVNGRFQWSTPPTPASPLLQLPMSSPNQVLSQPPPTMFASSQDDKRYQRLQSLHDPPRPNMYGYQLIGDSMLLRFSNKLLRESIIFKEGLRFLGYCVSGQKIGDLLKRLRAGFYHLGRKVVLMIGTNDLFQNTKVEQMCHELRRVVDHLRNEVDELVIITIPPVPLIEHMDHHWNRLNEYNRFIKQLPQKYHDARISVSDVSPLYLLSQEEIEEEEMLAVLNAEIPYCCGCLTCIEESEDVDWDCSALSDEDITDLSLVTRVLIDTNSHIKPLDTCGLFFDKKMQKCRRDFYELTYSDSSRKDLIHLNLKGLTVIKDQLVKIL